MKRSTQQITLIALFIAFCLLVPFLFHLVGLGKMFLPMFLPILMAGLIISYPHAIVVGFMGPWVSALATGMPPLFPTALSMSVEGLVTAGLASFLFQRSGISMWLSVFVAVIGQRVARICMLLLILPLLGLPARALSIADLTYSFPGVILQLTVVPLLINMLWKFKVVKKSHDRKSVNTTLF